MSEGHGFGRTQQPLNRWVSFGLMAVVLAYLTVSQSTLYTFGWQYEDTGGSALEKFHPATLLLSVLFAVALASWGNPLSAIIAILHEHPLLSVYLAGIAFMTWYAARVVQLPFTLFMETFVPAFFLFVLLRDMPETLGRRLALIIHAALFANAVLGIAEIALGFHVSPLVVNGEIIEDEPRSTALLGHPLGNAVLMGCYIFILALGGGRDLPAFLRPVCFLVAAASMAAFGGRAATGLLIACLLVLAAIRFAAVARGATFDTRSTLAGLVVVPLVALLGVGLNDLGFFDTFIDRVNDDTGSADTRIVMFELFRHQNWHDLIFAPDIGLVATWARLLGTEYGIESFVLQYVLTYGIIATCVFLPALFAFCVELTRGVRRGGAGVLVYFFIVALTSVSLSAKGPIFNILTLLLLVLLRRGPETAAARTEVSGVQLSGSGA